MNCSYCFSVRQHFEQPYLPNNEIILDEFGTKDNIKVLLELWHYVNFSLLDLRFCIIFHFLTITFGKKRIEAYLGEKRDLPDLTCGFQ